MTDLIDFATLKMLNDAGAVASYRLVVTADGTVLEAKIGKDTKKLATARGGLRQFAKLDTAASMLVLLGARLADLDLQQWEPKHSEVP